MRALAGPKLPRNLRWSGDGGRGFGLALTRLVCRRRGGDVTVHNQEEPGGAVFTATLPMLREGVEA